MMKKITYVVGLFVAIGLFAQDKKALKYAKMIRASDLKEHLSILAADEYEGRETGKKGQRMAAKYIANEFRKLGLEPPVDGSYFQKFSLKQTSLRDVYFKNGDKKIENLKDFLYYSRAETYGEDHVKIIFAGKGGSFDSLDLNEKYVMFSHNEWGGWQEKIDQAKAAGAAGMIVISENGEQFRFVLDRYASFPSQSSLSLTVSKDEDKLILGDKNLANKLFGKNFDELEAGVEVSLIFSADILIDDLETENVLGYLRGTEKPEELIIITSHYDHIGIINGEIYNGADDDGSGTVTVLELAESFVEAAKKKKGSKRSILFMTVTGEEKGLLGSGYYVQNPVFPLENTVTNLNIDMIGRIDEKHVDNPDYVYVIGSDKLSKELHDLSENVNKTYVNLELDYTYNDENDPNRFYYRSDHYNFAKNNIPIIFYFNGIHSDYHKPTDTMEKIAFGIMQKRARLIFHTGWELANRKERVKIN